MWLKGSLNVFSHLTMHCGRMMALRLMKMGTHNRFQTITVIRRKSGICWDLLCSRKLGVVLTAPYLPTDKQALVNPTLSSATVPIEVLSQFVPMNYLRG